MSLKFYSRPRRLKPALFSRKPPDTVQNIGAPANNAAAAQSPSPILPAEPELYESFNYNGFLQVAKLLQKKGLQIKHVPQNIRGPVATAEPAAAAAAAAAPPANNALDNYMLLARIAVQQNAAALTFIDKSLHVRSDMRYLALTSKCTPNDALVAFTAVLNSFNKTEQKNTRKLNQYFKMFFATHQNINFDQIQGLQTSFNPLKKKTMFDKIIKARDSYLNQAKKSFSNDF